MQLGETIATYDLGLALRGECGKFEVTSPAGEIYHVICKPNHSISNLEWAGSRNNPQPFIVRKITETVALENKKETIATQARPEVPFLVESQMDDGEPLFANSSPAASPVTTGEHVSFQQMVTLELRYLESNAETKQPVAWVAVMGSGAETVMTIRCATFNELDAEIRKLHAHLDEIRARARKQFYLAHAAAATA
jgi:hypothetical protein